MSSEYKICSEQNKNDMDNRARKMQSNEPSPIFFPILWNKLSWFGIFNGLKFDKLVADIRKVWPRQIPNRKGVDPHKSLGSRLIKLGLARFHFSSLGSRLIQLGIAQRQSNLAKQLFPTGRSLRHRNTRESRPKEDEVAITLQLVKTLPSGPKSNDGRIDS